MKYKIEPIGASFTNKDLINLEKHFDDWAKAGYKFHSVFQVSQPGCLGLGSPTITYLAVYVSEADNPS